MDKKAMILNKYFEYIESYVISYYELFNKSNILDNFYALGFLYTNIMELCLKFCILSYDGFPENYAIRDLDIGEHNFQKILNHPQTMDEFIDCGVTKKDIESIIELTNELFTICETNNLSFAFRYPTNKLGELYFKNISDKLDIILRQENSIRLMLKILNIYISGVATNLVKKADVLKNTIKIMTNHK